MNPLHLKCAEENVSANHLEPHGSRGKKTSYNNQYVLSYLMIFLTLKSKVSNYMN